MDKERRAKLDKILDMKVGELIDRFIEIKERRENNGVNEEERI